MNNLNILSESEAAKVLGGNSTDFYFRSAVAVAVVGFVVALIKIRSLDNEIALLGRDNLILKVIDDEADFSSGNFFYRCCNVSAHNFESHGDGCVNKCLGILY